MSRLNKKMAIVLTVIAVLVILLWKQARHLSAEPVRVTAVELLDANGGRLDYNYRVDKLVLDSEDQNRRYNIYTMDTDGSNKKKLTGNANSPSRNGNGNPSWYPSGDWIVFQAVNDAMYRQLPQQEATKRLIVSPGIGIANDIWITDQSGQHFYRVTDVQKNGFLAGGTLHPHFSYQGDKLVWAERIANIKGDPGGEWVIKVGNFTVVNGVPTVTDIITLQPGGDRQKRLYETHGFSPDGSKIIYTANSDGQSRFGFDIYTYDLTTKKTKRLTFTPVIWDEHAHYTADGNKILWMSSLNQNILATLKTDLWIMNDDGSVKQRLTRFNDPDYPFYIDNQGRGVVVGDFAIAPDGKTVYAYIILNPEQTAAYSQPGKVYKLTLDGV